MKIVDMHCDTLLEGWRHQDKSLVYGDFSINLRLLKEHDSLLQFFAIYISRKELKTTAAYEIFKSMYVYYKKFLSENSDVIKPVYNAKDVAYNKKRGFLSSLLTIEDGVFIEGKMERIDEVYDMGVRLITPIWNFETCVGYPNSDNPEIHKKGLKPFGFEFVEHMNEKGMIIDVSHMSEGGFYDVASHSKKPFVASHSCARTLCNHRRNLTDDQLKILGEKGGIVGVNFEKSFLKEKSAKATFDQVIQHLEYMRNIAGIDSIGFGSDFDGISDNGEMVNYGGFTTLLERLNEKFTADDVDKICYKNVIRLLKDTL